MVSVSDMVAAINTMRVGGPRSRPHRHQAVTLLWAIGRARRNMDRLTRWSEARPDLIFALRELGRPGSQPSAEYPFIALRKSGLWELNLEPGEQVPAAHSSSAKSWLDKRDPEGGLRSEVWQLVSSDASAAASLVDALVARFFEESDRESTSAIARLDSSVPSAPVALVNMTPELVEAERNVGEKKRTVGGRVQERHSVGSGYLQDSKLKMAIEQYAVQKVKQLYLDLGATEVEEVGKPYDLAVKGLGPERHVEVKGSSGSAAAVELTAGEVQHSKAHQPTDLVVVDGIRWCEGDRGYVLSGGRLRRWPNWQPEEQHLSPTRYRYDLPGGEGP
jgi:Domain of unknown function (DUF3883)